MIKQEDFLQKEGILSPEKEAMYLKKLNTAMAKIDNLSEEVANLNEENYDLKQQLANLKKLVYGQKSEKTEVVLAAYSARREHPQPQALCSHIA